MKKALSAVLALLMILSCMVFPTVAAEATTTIKDKVVLSNCDSGNGWHNFQASNRGSTVDRENFTEGTGSYSQTLKGSQLQSAYFEFTWYASNLTGGAEQNALDISKMAYLVFDVYLSDVSMAKTSGQIELRSIPTEACTVTGCYLNGAVGYCDNHEKFVDEALSTYFVSEPVVGWNTVKIDLATMRTAGTVDLTKISYFRMYRQKGSASYSNDNTEYSMKIDNVRFLPRYEADNGFDIVLSQGEQWKSDGAGVTFTYEEYQGHGKAGTGVYTGSLGANVINALLHLDKEPRDVSGTQNLAFWMYVSDASLLAGKKWQIELESNPDYNVDGEEINYDKFTLEQLNIVDGWNYVSIPLTKFTTNATYDATALNDIRIRMTESIDLGAETLTWALATVGFTNTAYVEPEEPVDPDAPVIPESAKPTLISIANCDQLDGFATGDHLLLDTTDPSQGKASVARTFDGATTGMVNGVPTIKFEYTIPNGKTYDATLMNQLSFDVWVSDPAAFADTKFELELFGIKDGTLDGDAKEIVKEGTLSDLKNDALVAGWNTISVDITTMTNKGATMESFCWFRLFSKGGAAGIEGQTSTIKLDNVYMTADPVVYTDKIPLTTNPSSRASAGTISPSYTSGDYMHSVTYGNTTYDITTMSYVEFDVKIDNEIVNQIHFRMDITSAGKSDVNQITRTRELSRWCGGDLPVNEWVHVKVPISFLQNSTGNWQIDHYEDKDGDGKAETPVYVGQAENNKIPDMTTIPDLTKINFFRFFSNKSTHITGDAYTGVYGCEMKNFTFTKELEGGEELVFDAETMVSGTHAAQFKGGTTSDVQLNSGGTLRDIDGDGDNEWVAQEKAEAGTLVNGNGAPIAGGLPVSFSFEDTVRNAAYANLVSLRFDFYCNDEAVLNHRFDFEMTSSRGSDVGEATGNYILKSLIIEDLGDGWYTVDIPLSKLTGRANGSNWSAPKAAFSANRFNFFRMFAHANLNWSAGCVMAVDNIRVTRAAADQIEEKFEIPEGAIPFTTGSLAIVDLNAGNNYLHGATSRALATRITPDVLDASVYNLFCGNLYIENIEELYDEMFCFEITSAGQCDKEESSINNAPLMAMFTRFDGQPLQNGYNYVYIDVYSELFNSHACDLTQADYIRIFNQSPVRATKNTVVTLSDLHFANENVLNAELAKNMKIEGATLTLNDNVSLNIIANIHPAMSDYTATLTIDGVIYEVEGTRIGTTNQVLFTTPEFQENELAKTFTFALVGKTADGKVISDELANYSVKQYCVDTLAAINNGIIYDTDGGEYSAMLTDLLVYAAAVEKLCGQTELVTDGVDLSKASTFAPLTVYNYQISGEQGNCPAEFDSVELNFDPLSDNINGIVTFKADSVEGLKVKVAVGSGEPIYITEFEDNGDGTYSFTIDMRVFEVNAAYTCTFDGYKDYSFVLSMGSALMVLRNAYLDELVEDPTDEEAQAAVELFEAIACYANSVYNYVACQQ